MIRFPKVIDHPIINYELILDLELGLNNLLGRILRRKYYQVEYGNHATLIFMTTNELDQNYKERILDHEFEIYFDVLQLFKGFDEIIDIDCFGAKWMKASELPKFIYYDIIHIKEAVYLKFKHEFLVQSSGYVATDFEKAQQKRIDYWLNFDYK